MAIGDVLDEVGPEQEAVLGAAHHGIEANAVAGDADFIVTRNMRDLRGAELRFRSLQVLSPEDFLKEL